MMTDSLAAVAAHQLTTQIEVAPVALSRSRRTRWRKFHLRLAVLPGPRACAGGAI